MKDKNVLYDVEKTIRSSLIESTGQSAPPFETIAGRIAAGQPAESFEEFFAGDIPGVNGSLQSGSTRRSVTIAVGASAAALLFLLAGGVLLGAIFGGTVLDTRSAADSVEYSCQETEDSTADKAAGVCEQSDEEYVSDSDWKDSDLHDSSDTSK